MHVRMFLNLLLTLQRGNEWWDAYLYWKGIKWRLLCLRMNEKIVYCICIYFHIYIMYIHLHVCVFAMCRHARDRGTSGCGGVQQGNAAPRRRVDRVRLLLPRRRLGHLLPPDRRDAAEPGAGHQERRLDQVQRCKWRASLLLTARKPMLLSWHEGAHLISQNPSGSPTFAAIQVLPLLYAPMYIHTYIVACIHNNEPFSPGCERVVSASTSASITRRSVLSIRPHRDVHPDLTAAGGHPLQLVPGRLGLEALPPRLGGFQREQR